MPRGASPKREREYEELVGEFKQEHRYPGREKEVASRIVNKQRSQYGETKEKKATAKKGKSADKELPIAHYERMTIPDIRRALPELKAADKRKILNFEKKHKNRKGVLELFQAA